MGEVSEGDMDGGEFRTEDGVSFVFAGGIYVQCCVREWVDYCSTQA